LNEYVRKRDVKAGRKTKKNKMIKEGKDDDSYLSEAFE